MQKNNMVKWRTGRRPYTSDSGEMTNGPMAEERINIDKTICVVNSVGMPNSCCRTGRAGATMLEEMGDTIMKSERTSVAIHRLDDGQFFGFSLDKSQSSYIDGEGNHPYLVLVPT